MKEGIRWFPRVVVGLIGSCLLLLGSCHTRVIGQVSESTFSEAFRITRGQAQPDSVPIQAAPGPVSDNQVEDTSVPIQEPPDPVVMGRARTLQRVLSTTRDSRDVVPTTLQYSPSQQFPIPNLIGQQYRYYERSQDVTALQELLGMASVDGVYGPNTRRAHIAALGGSTAAIYHFYPEIGQTPTPCSHGCLPGDEHYELPTLGALINEYFLPEDRVLAQRIVFCESSGRSWDTGSLEVSSALAIGWFQHLAKYWVERSEKAGWADYDPFNGRANVAVAAWLFYTSGVHHWNPSKACWEDHVA
ncbi:MAG: hypothetical protein CL489_06515 [Acidobacteria bacterium]|nr:hypothetical protein [Acidobacteriota bacterium]|tara:strand:- start:2543 stop:3448 length:906 start_codon:yes stop_codon:yes gene_type:complete